MSTNIDLITPLKNLADFNVQVFKTINLALANGMGTDILDAIGTVTGAVAARGLDPAQDLAALQKINKIINDLANARKTVQSGMPVNTTDTAMQPPVSVS